MASSRRIFGKAKRRGAEAGPVRVALGRAGLHALDEADFAQGDSEGFWRWFAANAERAAAMNREMQDGRDPEALVAPLFNALQRYDGGLSLLVGSTESGDCELIISGDGIMANFPAVVRLVAAAPKIDGWRVMAFKPRVEGSAQISVNGHTVDAENATFEARKDASASRLDVEIELPWLGKLPRDPQMQIAFLLLDNLLGEYDVATCIGAVDVIMRDRKAAPRGKPLNRLPAEVDALGAQRPRH